MNYTREQIRKAIENYADVNAPTLKHNKDREDIINMATSIYCTKYNVSFPGGGFAQAVANNDLTAAVSRADQTNITQLKFYVQLLYNFRPDNFID